MEQGAIFTQTVFKEVFDEKGLHIVGLDFFFSTSKNMPLYNQADSLGTVREIQIKCLKSSLLSSPLLTDSYLF